MTQYADSVPRIQIIDIIAYLILHIIDRLEALLSVRFELSKGDYFINNIVINNI